MINGGDICWNQIRKKNADSTNISVDFKINPSLNSGGTYDDGAWMGFTDGWIFYNQAKEVVFIIGKGWWPQYVNDLKPTHVAYTTGDRFNQLLQWNETLSNYVSNTWYNVRIARYAPAEFSIKSDFGDATNSSLDYANNLYFAISMQASTDGFLVDDLRIRKYISPEPSVNVSAETSNLVKEIKYLTNASAPEYTPIWTVDGNEILYVYQRLVWNNRDSYRMFANGSDQHRTYIGESDIQGLEDITQNGTQLLLSKYPYDIYLKIDTFSNYVH